MTPDAVLKSERSSLKKEEALSLYRKLILARLTEEKIREVYPKDEIKTACHLGVGGEAIPVGVCHVLPQGSKTLGTYRNHALYLAVTGETDLFFAELYGKATGAAKGKAGSMHLCDPARGFLATSAVVGTPIPVAVGAALALDYKKAPGVVAVFFGDGAMEEGVFWESLNFACLHHMRILFVCEDNGLAIHTFGAERQGFRSIPEAVQGFDCYSSSDDGSNIQKVVKQTRQALQFMAADPKPAFLHFTYFRFLEHVGPGEDFKAGYRKRPSDEELERLDPVRNFEKDLRGLGIDERELEAVRNSVAQQIERSLARARQAPYPEAGELHRDVLA